MKINKKLKGFSIVSFLWKMLPESRIKKIGRKFYNRKVLARYLLKEFPAILTRYDIKIILKLKEKFFEFGNGSTIFHIDEDDIGNRFQEWLIKDGKIISEALKSKQKDILISYWLLNEFGWQINNIIANEEYKKEIQSLYLSILNRVYRILPHNGVKVVEEDWDYLIILDACRYDVFTELNTIPGRLEKRISMGSSTPEWLKKNFDKYYEDIVYVSANPRISNLEFTGFKGTDHFFKVENVWDYGWDEELSTVPPEEVTKAALKMKEKYPNKRMIIHYMQPHGPWIGETKLSGKELNTSFRTATEWVMSGNRWGDVWKKIRNGKINPVKVKKAYRDNLKLVLNEVKKLVEELDGKIVISADHGECFGEKFLFEHPSGVYVKELVEVPWLVIEKPRKYENVEEKRIKEIIRELKTKKKL